MLNSASYNELLYVIVLLQIDRCSMGSSGDFGGESLRKKLYKLREENTSLVNQNHNLMTELEKMEYELHHERNNVSTVLSKVM